MIENINRRTVENDAPREETGEFSFERPPDKRLQFLLTALVVGVFLVLIIGSALTTRPESDEGGFANPAYNLAFNGHFGTTVYEMEKSPLTRIDQRTYWVMPMFLLNAAASFKAFGFSLFAMRSVSIFWGLILIAAWYFIVLKLSGNRRTAILALAFVALNYVVIITASIGRGDAMCAALGFSAFAVYLGLRERNLLLAIFISQCLVTLGGLTHFNGLLAFFGLLFLTIYYDRRALGWRHILVAAAPYLVGGTAFGIWVLQDPQAFKDQFIDNATMSGRMGALSSPFSGFIKEFTLRYPRAFGLLETTKGYSGPIYLKSLALVGYALGIVGVLFTAKLRREYKILLILTFIYFVAMSLMDGQKLAAYLLYIVPLYCALLSVWIYHLWEKRLVPRPLLVLGAIGFLLLQTGGVALRVKQNSYGNYYLPAMQYLNENAADSDLIMASAEARFALKPTANHITDGRFAFYTGKRPKYIVYDPGVEDSLKDSATYFPEFREYFPRLLAEEYTIAYENAAFKIYVRR